MKFLNNLTAETAFAGATALVVLGFMSFTGIYFFTHPGPDYHQVCKTRRVSEIGNCASDGQCAVRYTDGTTGSPYFPMRGAMVKECTVEAVKR